VPVGEQISTASMLLVANDFLGRSRHLGNVAALRQGARCLGVHVGNPPHFCLGQPEGQRLRDNLPDPSRAYIPNEVFFPLITFLSPKKQLSAVSY